MVKDKSKAIRMYDTEGFKRRASCICVRTEEAVEVLLISSSGKPGKWKLPGGGLEPGEEPREAASREVLEEAGVLGRLGRSLGIFENPEQKERTEVYIMVVTKELDEWEESIDRDRKRKWFRLEEAIEKVALYKPLQRNYLQQLCQPKTTKIHNI